MKPSRLVIGATILSVALPAAAWGQAAAVSDPNDTRGKLDIREVLQQGNADPEDQTNTISYTFGIATYDRWGCAFVSSPVKARLVLKFDDQGNDQPEYQGRFDCQDGEMLFLLRSTDGENNYEPSEVRKGPRRVRVTLPADFFRRAPHTWAVSTNTRTRACDPCRDRAPDNGPVS